MGTSTPLWLKLGEDLDDTREYLRAFTKVKDDAVLKDLQNPKSELCRTLGPEGCKSLELAIKYSADNLPTNNEEKGKEEEEEDGDDDDIMEAKHEHEDEDDEPTKASSTRCAKLQRKQKAMQRRNLSIPGTILNSSQTRQPISLTIQCMRQNFTVANMPEELDLALVRTLKTIGWKSFLNPRSRENVKQGLRYFGWPQHVNVATKSLIWDRHLSALPELADELKQIEKVKEGEEEQEEGKQAKKKVEMNFEIAVRKEIMKEGRQKTKAKIDKESEERSKKTKKSKKSKKGKEESEKKKLRKIQNKVKKFISDLRILNGGALLQKFLRRETRYLGPLIDEGIFDRLEISEREKSGTSKEPSLVTLTGFFPLAQFAGRDGAWGRRTLEDSERGFGVTLDFTKDRIQVQAATVFEAVARFRSCCLYASYLIGRGDFLDVNYFELEILLKLYDETTQAETFYNMILDDIAPYHESGKLAQEEEELLKDLFDSGTLSKLLVDVLLKDDTKTRPNVTKSRLVLFDPLSPDFLV